MTISMYQASVPVFIRALNNLSHLLAKGAAHAETRKFDPVALTGARLFPDMLPLTRQVHIAADMAKNGAARLAGLDPPKFEDVETTFPDLEVRIRKTIDYLKTFKPEQIDGSEARAITLQTPRGALNFDGLSFLQGFVVPNLYFHVTTTYDILRHNGVEIGKMDYIGAP